MQPSRDEGEAEPKLTRKSPFIPTRRLCPRCLNPLQPGSQLGGWLVPQYYYCTACGYKGTVFIEEGVEPRKEGGG